MDVRALLRKEALTVRRNAGLFVVVLVLLPAMLTGVTAVYERSIPEDVPVGVVPAGDNTSETELAVTRTGVDAFATPVSYESHEAARDGLAREEVYLVVAVPPDLGTEGAEVEFTVVTDRTMVPFEEPATLSVAALDRRLDDALVSDVTVTHERVGDQRALTAYLIPVCLVAFVLVYGLVFVPYQVRSERLVLDRLQTTSRLETVLATKIAFYGALTIVPIAVAALVASWMGFDVAILSVFSFVSLTLTFVLVAAVGLATLFAMRLRRLALFANVGLLFALLSLSALVYPVGFFSTTRKAIARTLPTHYATVATRSAMLRDAPMALYAEYLFWVAGAAVLALGGLVLALGSYRRRQ